jgi:lipopolysaccharide biosynthesis regulator YciM
MWELLLLLLPVAAASGWWAAKRSESRQSEICTEPDPAYFRGLNYLLNEQPDKAIDVFLRLAEVDSETVETHLALGNLFRRRGEVDRAIRIHQNLVARPALSPPQRAGALLELGQDYMRAGLFDRAESLFKELIDMKQHRSKALANLREIYQQEKDWVRCLEVAQQLERVTGKRFPNEIANYHCELAREALRAGDTERASKQLRQAHAADKHCVRATMLQAEIEMARGDLEAAVTTYRRVEQQGPEYLPEILPALLEGYRRLGERDDMVSVLKQLYRSHPNSAVMLALADIIENDEGNAAAAAFVAEHLKIQADLHGLERLLDLDGRSPTCNAGQREMLKTLLQVVRRLREGQPAYQCEHCGFVAKRLHWQCPSCNSWGRVKPVQPVVLLSGQD